MSSVIPPGWAVGVVETELGVWLGLSPRDATAAEVERGGGVVMHVLEVRDGACWRRAWLDALTSAWGRYTDARSGSPTANGGDDA